MMKNRAGWLALIVLAIASLLMVFVVMPRIDQDRRQAGDANTAGSDAAKNGLAAPQQASKNAETPKGPDPAPTAAPSGNASATPPTTAATSTKQAEMVPPSFDVLRVEPDGSTVIAGRAAPGSTVEVTNGSAVIAKAEVGPSGDFAIVLENPLPPGDHQLVLKATGKDGKSVASQETATISIPSDGMSGKLLAIVTTPGKASRVIAAPAPQSAQPASPTAGQQAAGSQPNTADAVVAAGQPASPPDGASSMPPLPQASSALTSAAPAMTPGSPSATSGSASPAEIQVTAVEIEGSKIFVAGMAKSGTTVRGLADGKAIGTAVAGQNGSFVIEGTMDLSVGDHRIAVESLGAGGQVQMRVEVPFNRPAGEQVAAVAASAQSAEMMARIDDGSFNKLREDAVRAFNLLHGLYDGGKQPSLEELGAARSATAIALKALSEYRLPADVGPAARGLAANAAKDAAEAYAMLDALPRDAEAVGKGLGKLGEMLAKAVGPTAARGLKGFEPKETEQPQASTSAGGAATVQQAPLTQSDRNSVIIRRGDTLWQISRRVYGQGVRYTTIYLANEDKIANPDIIQPGQIFGVPDEYRPDAEELHRQRLIQKRS